MGDLPTQNKFKPGHSDLFFIYRITELYYLSYIDSNVGSAKNVFSRTVAQPKTDEEELAALIDRAKTIKQSIDNAHFQVSDSVAYLINAFLLSSNKSHK